MKTWIFIIFVIFSFCQCSPKSGNVYNKNENLSGKTIQSGSFNCIVEFDDFDKLTRTRILGLKNERLFTFTQEKLYDVFVDRPFMEASGALSRNNNNQYFLMLSFTIDTKYVKSGYNGISTTNMLRLTLINGEQVFLTNTYNDYGKIDKSSGAITYKGIFPVTKKNLKLLRKYELDKMGVMWNGGFEEYDIFNLDILLRHYSCLKSFKF